MNIQQITEAQHAFFNTGATRALPFRKRALASLRQAILSHEGALNAALRADLNKPPFESYMCEIGLVLAELTYMERHLNALARPRRARTPSAQFPARSVVLAEPLGVALVMSPWNYPLMLCLDPVVGAIAAGNCVVMKPSAYAPETSRVIGELIESAFPAEYLAVVQGGRAENAALLEQRFDYIFFTGGVDVGRLVMEKAAAHLTPVTLELGGKSPCIVDKTADLKLAAKRIVFGKFLNAGQTCVAPDYLFVEEGCRDALVGYLKMFITELFGDEPLKRDDYGKIVNERHFKRVLGLMEGCEILHGGRSDAQRLTLEPTLLGGVTSESPVMREEIFGPLLPILTFRDISEALDYVNQKEKPLALYLFTTDKAVERRVLGSCSFGGGCVNDTVIHLATSDMPFGGVGGSGMGGYHGKQSFSTFTHYKSIVKKSNRLDLPMRYRPYTDENAKWLRRFLK